jgi:hypothetical protein
VSFKVNPAPTYEISLDQSGTYIFEAQTPDEAQTPVTFTVTNTGNQPTGDVTGALSGTYANSFTVTQPNPGSITAGNGTATFTVTPKPNLAAGTHTATVTVKGTYTTPKTFYVSFTATYGISLSLSPDNVPVNSDIPLSFGWVGRDYTVAQTPPPLTIAISNTGNQPMGALTVSAGAGFDVTQPENGATTGTATFTVGPKTGLPGSEYTPTVTVSGGNNISASFGVSFTVYNSHLILADNTADNSNIWFGAAHLGALCSEAGANTSITVNGQNAVKNQITGAVFDAAEFANVTTLPNNFCRYFTALTELDLSGFTGLTSMGERFLYGCSSFNQELTLPPNLNSIGNIFMDSCTSFNQPLTLPDGITSIGHNFLWGCTSFNQPLTLPESLTYIRYSFLKNCRAFNQDLVIPASVTSIESVDVAQFPDQRFAFMENCDSMTSVVTVNCSVTAFSPNDIRSFTTTNPNAASCTTGITIAGPDKTEIIELFPNRTTSPYRKLIAAP